MGMFDFAQIPWMNDRDPNAAASISASSHNFTNTQNLSQQRDEFAARLPLWMQEQENRNLESKTKLQGEGLDNQLKAMLMRNKMEDQQTMADWIQRNGATPQSMLSATPPIMKTPEGQQKISSLLSSMSTSVAGNALMKHQASMFKSATDLLEKTGVNAFSVDDKGQPTVDQDLLSKGWQLSQEETHARRMDETKLRADNALAVQVERGKFGMDELQAKLQAAAQKPVKAFQSPSAKAAYDAELDIIKKDDAMGIDDKFSKIAQLEKNYKVNNPEGQPTPSIASPAPSARAKTVIQNGNKFNVMPDGTYQYLGRAD